MAGSAIARASAIMASGTVVSRLLGIVKVVVLAYAIGQVGSISGDAYANGNMLPNLLYTVLLGGMLNAVLVPQIVKAAKKADGGQGYINKLLTFVVVSLIAITIVIMFATPWIVTAFTLAFPQINASSQSRLPTGACRRSSSSVSIRCSVKC